MRRALEKQTLFRHLKTDKSVNRERGGEGEGDKLSAACECVCAAIKIRSFSSGGKTDPDKHVNCEPDTGGDHQHTFFKLLHAALETL